MIGDGLTNTLILMVLTPTVTLALAVCFSWVVLRSRLPGRNWFDFVAFLPHAMPNIVFGIGALLIAFFVDAALRAGFRHAVAAAGRLHRRPHLLCDAHDQYRPHPDSSESSRNRARSAAPRTGSIIAKIVVPLLAPTLLNAWLWIALLTFRELTLAVLLTTRDNITLPVVIWSLWLGGGLGDAAAVALVMLCGMIPIIGLYWFVARKTGLRAD